MELVEVKILFFAKSRELVGVAETTVNIEPHLTESQLRKAVVCKFPSLKVIENNFLIALNEDYLSPNDDITIDLTSGDELAIIPPISGG